MASNDDLMAQISQMMHSGAGADSPEAKALAEKVVARLNAMSPEQAQALGDTIAQTLGHTRNTFDTNSDMVISQKEILAVAAKKPAELLALLPEDMRGSTGSIVKAGLSTHGDAVANACADTNTLQKQFDTAQKQINDVIGNLKTANNVSFVNFVGLDPAGSAVNTKLRENFGADAPQLNTAGRENLNTLIGATAEALPDKVKFPSADVACEAVRPQQPTVVVADNSSVQRM